MNLLRRLRARFAPKRKFLTPAQLDDDSLAVVNFVTAPGVKVIRPDGWQQTADGLSCRVVRDVKFHGPIVLDPRYTPPWPGAGIIAVHED